jgi:hypothetical protein
VRVGRFFFLHRKWRFGQDHRSNQPFARCVDSKKKRKKNTGCVGVVYIVVLYVKELEIIIDQLRQTAFGLEYTRTHVYIE